jgi:2-oxo-3-hexenedioate decarboxylase/2-keto-4-pentenoate hydratase
MSAADRHGAVAGRVEAAAARLAAGRLGRERMGALPPDLRPTDEREAYAVQAALHRRLGAAGWGAVVGHKIGCTTAVMQAYLGIATPCAGGVFAPTAVEAIPDGAVTLPHARFARVGVECELAVRLGADLGAAGAPYDASSVASAVATVMPAIEIVDDRWQDYRAVDTPTLIADDFFGAGCVLGPARVDWRGLDLAALTGAMRINGEVVGRGRGADILGHPLAALAWLANAQAARGGELRAGEIVCLGSLVATRWLARGDEASIEIESLGHAAIRFA